MSIIYEALKKVEKNQKARPVDNGIEALKVFNSAQIKRKIFPRKIMIASIILVLISLGFILYLTGKKYNPNPVLAKEEEKIKATYRKPENYPEMIPSVYVLEGVVQDKETSFAVINGKVLQMLDKIDDFMINKISEDEVELINLKDNSKLILSLSF